MKTKCNPGTYAFAGLVALLFLATAADAVAEPTPASGRRSSRAGASQGFSNIGAKKATPKVSQTDTQLSKQGAGKSAEEAGKDVTAKGVEKAAPPKVTFLPLLKPQRREKSEGGVDLSKVVSKLPDLVIVDMKLEAAGSKALHILVKTRGMLMPVPLRWAFVTLFPKQSSLHWQRFRA